MIDNFLVKICSQLGIQGYESACKKVVIITAASLIVFAISNFFVFIVKHLSKIMILLSIAIFVINASRHEPFYAETAVDVLRDILTIKNDKNEENAAIDIEITACQYLLSVARSNLKDISDPRVGSRIYHKALDMIVIIVGQSPFHQHTQHMPCEPMVSDALSLCIVSLELLRQLAAKSNAIEKNMIKEKVAQVKQIAMTISQVV